MDFWHYQQDITGPPELQAAPGDARMMLKGKHSKAILKKKKITPISHGKKGKRQLKMELNIRFFKPCRGDSVFLEL